jgi:flagellar M-ring protein FliF
MPAAGSSNNLLSDQSGGQPLLGQAGMTPEQMAERVMAVDNEIERMINMEQVEGRVRASSLKKISEIVDKHPEQAVAILRNWLYQDNNR